MYAVIRRYTAAAAIFEELQQQQGEVQELLRAVPGFVTYYAIRAADGVGATITVCEDQTGTTESVRVAADWVRRRVPNAVGTPPQVTEGEVIFSFGK
jgi:uncharacterized protein YmfQ (DUF2313 family)